jgi:DNA polymerase elongation subunit (family B)
MYNQRKTYAKNTPENLSIKLALNSTYGNSNNQYSPFYDPQYTMAITLNGQLSLCMLIEDILELSEASSVQSNTDGITMKIRKEDSDKADKIVKEWETATKLEMERNDYSRMHIRDVNNYVAVYAKNGKVKLKGAYVYELEHHKDQSSVVVQKAVAEHLATGVSIADYITNHKNKFDFMLRTKVPKSMTLVLVDDNGNETVQQNVTRYYVSNGKVSGSLIKIMPPVSGKEENRRAGICVGNKVKVCNNVLDFSWDIDYSYYITEAEKLISAF